jgi:hypothetical protein
LDAVPARVGCLAIERMLLTGDRKNISVEAENPAQESGN